MPGHLIRRVYQVSTAMFAEECGNLDLTPVQYAALVATRAHPRVDATRLCALIHFDRSTIGDVLDRLESKGWIVRRPSPKDRRVKLLSISAEGRRILEQVQPAVRRVQVRLLEPLSLNDRKIMVRLLTRLADVHKDILPG